MEAEHPVDDVLQALAEGSLPPEEAREVEEHVRGCPGCRAGLDAYRTLFRALEEDPPPLPDGFVAEVMTSVRRETQARPGRVGTTWKVAALFAAAAAFVVVASLLDLDRKSLDVMPGLPSRLGERIPDEFPLPASVEDAVTRAFDGAERRWGGVVNLTEEALGVRRSLGVPWIAGIIALFGVLNLAAFWKLRSDRTGGQP